MKVFIDNGPGVWRLPHQRYAPECLKRSVEHTTKVMFRGRVSQNGAQHLYFVNWSVNTEVYLEILEYHSCHPSMSFWRPGVHIPAGFGTCIWFQGHQEMVGKTSPFWTGWPTPQTLNQSSSDKSDHWVRLGHHEAQDEWMRSTTTRTQQPARNWRKLAIHYC